MALHHNRAGELVSTDKPRTDGYHINRKGELVRIPDAEENTAAYDIIMEVIRNFGYYEVLGCLIDLCYNDADGKWPPADGVPQSQMDLAEALAEPLHELLDKVYPDFVE